MNFLAHIYLSFDDDEITIGNFIADSIRGNKFTHLPDRIQKGIKLHRHIDTFTDAHPTVRKSTKRLHENYGHYSGIIVDIFYDHYLAKNWKVYSDTPLDVFVNNFYDLLEDNYEILPIGVQRMMPYMISDNWIFNYSKMDGIARVLNGMNRRTKELSKMDLAIHDLAANYEEIEKDFELFFKKLMDFTTKTVKELYEKMGENK